MKTHIFVFWVNPELLLNNYDVHFRKKNHQLETMQQTYLKKYLGF